MKRIIKAGRIQAMRLMLAVAAVAVLAGAGVAAGQTTTFLGPAGQYDGQARTFGGATQYFGPAGEYQGSARALGATTNFFWSRGRIRRIGADGRRSDAILWAGRAV